MNGEDTYFWMMLASQGRNFLLNRKPHAFVRFHCQSQSCRLRTGYYDGLIKFFKKVLNSGMLKIREDVFLAHASVFLRLCEMRSPEAARYFLLMLRRPDLILKYVRSYYGKGARQMRLLYKFLEESRKSVASSQGKIPKMPDLEYEYSAKKADTSK